MTGPNAPCTVLPILDDRQSMAEASEKLRDAGLHPLRFWRVDFDRDDEHRPFPSTIRLGTIAGLADWARAMLDRPTAWGDREPRRLHERARISLHVDTVRAYRLSGERVR